MSARIAALALSLAASVASARSVKDAPREVGPTATLAPAGEPGEPMVLGITVEDAAGKPAAGALIYAYHTDANGDYGPSGNQDPRLFGYARTGKDGKVSLRTIRPGPYPRGGVPAHVHVEIEAGGAPVLHDECWFAGDRFLRPDVLEHEGKRGRLSRIVTLAKRDGAWHGEWVVQLPARR
jgi:protocatechuate 3,4-dioxygenase beta subunit